MLSSISLYTGAGGLDIGLEAAGFEPTICVEIDSTARATLAANRPQWSLSSKPDVSTMTAEEILAEAALERREGALLAAGPVCQPFSSAARWAASGSRGLADPRASTLHWTMALVRAALPQVLLVENVRGIFEGGTKSGFTLIQQALAKINHDECVAYRPQVLHLNAAAFGVPQVRRRTIIIADRSGRELTEPIPTHGTVGRPFPTAWDALFDLPPAPAGASAELATGKWAELLPSIPEGENYLWHTARGGGLELFGWRTRFWTFLLKLAKSRPAWTLTASPGPSTGPFHWDNRPLTISEMLRLQTFPDSYVISGDRRSQVMQIGNAVPALLAEHIGRAIAQQWFGVHPGDELAFKSQDHRKAPPATPVSPVPAHYLGLVGTHAPHPGPGKGPKPRPTEAAE